VTVNSAGPMVAVVGIGADGWDGLSSESRAAVSGAEVIIGSDRQLDMIDQSAVGERVTWPPPPLLPAIPVLLQLHQGRRLCVLASGDPMFFGIGSTLVRLVGSDGVRVLPHVSSVSLACARLGWSVEDVTVVSAVGRPIETLHPAVQPGRRLLVLAGDGSAAEQISVLLRGRGFGPSRMVLLESLGGHSERLDFGTAQDWTRRIHDRLAIVAIDCLPGVNADVLPIVPGLPDSAYETDGQLTKREIRAVTLSALRPLQAQLLWDVGGGTGTIGIEWMRTHPSCRAIAVEPRADRRQRIEANARALGVPGLKVVDGAAPQALNGLPRPDAVFVGGAVSVAGVIDACMDALQPGGRLVANAVTLEAETTLATWHARLGGELIRMSITRAAAVGSFTGWRAAMPVTQWIYTTEVSQ
jgi:precorrin-6B C5,15-methyltransferase / cobalt-precorrin-6B C5,C15-methyltransferase